MTQVLIIEDDDAGARYILARAFIAAGYSVSEAGNAAEGIALFDAEKPDLVVTDLMMPGVDGIEFINLLKKRNADAFVIAISGHSGAQNPQAARLMGASTVFEKPVNPFIIVEAANELFAHEPAVPLRPESAIAAPPGRRTVPG
jgi:sigma-B regulation protein RsbU (phosphoserine phosphatase)